MQGIKSFNAFTETALCVEVNKIRSADIKAAAAIGEVATDPLFLADVEETTTNFRWADSDRLADAAGNSGTAGLSVARSDPSLTLLI